MKKRNVLQKVLSMALTLSLLAGCGGTPTQESEQPTPSQAQNNEALQAPADVVVVGGGLSGLTAAVFAAKGGASVVLVEKLGLLGGSGLLSSGGMMTCNTNGLIDGEDSVEAVQDHWKNTSALKESSGYPDMERVNALLAETGNTVNALVDMGLSVGRTIPNTAGTGSIVMAEGGGAGLISALTEIAENNGVTVYTNCKAEELIVENDAVVGVKVTDKEGTSELKASYVILACGGFSRSQELISELTPEGAVVYDGRGCVGNTGDGIVMAQAVGAELYENQTLMMSYCQVDAEYNRQAGANSAITFGNTMVVNDEGKRFENEGHSSYSAFGVTMVEKGYDHCYALLNATEDNRDILEQGVTMGEVVKASSVEELADALHMNGETLRNTFDKYALACENEMDEEFGKSATNLIALDEAELYAVKFYPTSIGTIGGVKTNYDCQVLRADGSAIEGLFAVGEMSNRSFYNYHYVGAASLGLYSTMARLTGELVAEKVAH